MNNATNINRTLLRALTIRAACLIAQLSVLLSITNSTVVAQQPTNPLGPTERTCAVATSALKSKTQLTSKEISSLFACSGDRAAGAELLWEKLPAHAAEFKTLSSFSSGVMTPGLLERLGEIANSAPSFAKRQSALRAIFAAGDPRLVVSAEDSAGTIIYSVLALSHNPTPPVPDLRKRALQIIRSLTRSANSSDIREAAKLYLQAIDNVRNQ